MERIIAKQRVGDSDSIHKGNINPFFFFNKGLGGKILRHFFALYNFRR